MKSVSQEELDWFVEGEFEKEQRDEFFERLDAEQDGWKRCALALLERDALSVSLSSLSKGNSVPAIESIVPKVTTPNDAASKQASEESDSKHVSVFRILTMAASIVGLFFAGYWVAGQRSAVVAIAEFDESQIDHPILRRVSNQDPEMIRDLNIAVESISVADRHVIALVALRRNQRQVVIPVIESEMLSRQFAMLPPPEVPVQLSMKLQKSGFNVQPNRQFLSVHHEDGSNEVLAVNMLNCQYVGKPVF